MRGPAGLMLSHLLANSGIDNVAIDTRARNEIETMSIQPGGAHGVSASLSANATSNDLCYQRKTLLRTAIIKFLHLIACQSCTFNACVPMMTCLLPTRCFVGLSPSVRGNDEEHSQDAR